MSTHNAVVTVAPGRLQILEVTTPTVLGNKVKLINQWTASTPLDLHQADGHFLVSPPQVLGDGVAGTVLEVGPEVKFLQPGDRVFGFTWRNEEEKAHQLYVVTTENVLGKLPAGLSMQEVVTVPNNFVTAWHALTKDLGFELPWPKPSGHVPPEKDQWILVWGGSSSVGMYALQILRYYGYGNVITAASKVHHERLFRYGARVCYDYREADVVTHIREYLQKEAGQIVFALDCIGHRIGSVGPVAQLVNTSAARVAVLLPVILKDAALGVRPEYELDARVCTAWAPGVDVYGVRTHSYTEDNFLAEKLQPEIMPWVLAKGVVEPNDRTLIEGGTLLERAEKALAMLREKNISGGRLVWRIAEDDEVEAALKMLRG